MDETFSLQMFIAEHRGYSCLSWDETHLKELGHYSKSVVDELHMDLKGSKLCFPASPGKEMTAIFPLQS